MKSSVFSILWIVLCFWATPALAKDPSSAAAQKVFNAQSFTLENGLQVVVVTNRRAPVVTHMIWYRFGAADEKPGKSGQAHFFEHMMFKGTKNVPPGEFSTRVRALGGNDNAFTSHDFTAYFQSIAKQHLETVMTMEADRMRNLDPPSDHFASEHKVIMEERRERTENDPSGFLTEQMKASLFVNHPYGTPVIGWMHEIENLTWNDLKPAYDDHYEPNNAIVVISGDVTMDEVKPLAEKIYGPIKAHTVPERNWTKVPPLLAAPHLTLRHPQVRQPVLIRLYRVPSLRTAQEESLALSVLEDILDGGAATRLYKSIVVEKKLATSVSFSYDSVAWDDGTIWMSATPAEGVSLETLEKAIDDELALLVKNGVTAQEVAEAKTRMMDESIFARDSLTGPAMIIGRALISGIALDTIERWPALIDGVTEEQIEAAAKAYLDPVNFNRRPYVTGYLLPEEKAAAMEAKTETKTP